MVYVHHHTRMAPCFTVNRHSEQLSYDCVINCLLNTPTKYYQARSTFGKVTAKIKREQFFMTHSVGWRSHFSTVIVQTQIHISIRLQCLEHRWLVNILSKQVSSIWSPWQAGGLLSGWKSSDDYQKHDSPHVNYKMTDWLFINLHRCINDILTSRTELLVHEIKVSNQLT